ncbi:MAG: hypothetical protein CM15mP123_05320 [Gammaproteobacteria bacterium]|nr:MAG: hypothetical protein CM15mP123_05320 [Gammaproteobacteria bacterium]
MEQRQDCLWNCWDWESNKLFSLLRSLDFQVIEKKFPDHHEFIDTDFSELNDLPIVMTEKDAIKCKFLKILIAGI